jgi:hypothetical protein
MSPLECIEQLERLHRPHSIYEECGHDHTPIEAGVFEVEDVGLVCKEGWLYDICRACCCDAVGEQTEQCADAHTHAQGLSWCETARILHLFRKEYHA